MLERVEADDTKLSHQCAFAITHVVTSYKADVFVVGCATVQRSKFNFISTDKRAITVFFRWRKNRRGWSTARRTNGVDIINSSIPILRKARENTADDITTTKWNWSMVRVVCSPGPILIQTKIYFWQTLAVQHWQFIETKPMANLCAQDVMQHTLLTCRYIDIGWTQGLYRVIATWWLS